MYRGRGLSTRQISFLHLGDIHYPDLLGAAPLVDHKDQGVSGGAVQAIASSRIAEIAREVDRIRRTEVDLAAVIQTGDLTSKGNEDGYRKCLSFLRSVLKIEDAGYWKDRHFVAVPGNHDVNRLTVNSAADPTVKFQPLVEQWINIFGSSDYLTVVDPEPRDCPFDGASAHSSTIRFIPINTCLMCGEFRAIPEKIRAKVVSLLGDLKSEISSDEFENIMREQIDCPAVSREHVDAVGRHISNCDDHGVSVVVGHHPILAQPIPRIDGYGELINAGYVREVMLNTRRNVLYLHGHIHQSPVLAVNSPIKGSNRIIHISAPALEAGFNLLRIHFSTSTGQPLGLELIKYSFGEHLGLSAEEPVRLRLIDQDSIWNEIEGPWVKHVLDCLPRPDAILRYRDIERRVPSMLAGTLSEEQRVDALRSAITLLELLEIVAITNREKHPSHWQCHRRTI